MTESIWFLDALVRVHVPAAETDGAYAMLELLLPPGHMPPPHVHAADGEGFLVLDGELTIHTEDGAVVLGAGDAGHGPAGRVHTVEVTSEEPARILVVSAPAGFEAFVRAAGVPAERDELPVPDGPPDVERLARIAAEHGITFVGPPGSRPCDVAATA